MKRIASLVMAAALIAVAGTSEGWAQDARESASAPVQLRVDVVITRSLGEKRISVLPQTLMGLIDAPRSGSSAAGTTAVMSLRVGVDVPTGLQGQANQTVTRLVGTNIDAFAQLVSDGRYRVSLQIEDSSAHTSPGQLENVRPTAFRNLRASVVVMLRDGQKVAFMSGTDKVTGETITGDVTLTVVK